MSNVLFRMPRSAGTAAATAAVALLLVGCSSDLASFDDTYVPQSVEENFPITVVEKPLKLTLDATAGRIQQGDVNEVTRFARDAVARANTPVTVGYSAGSRQARLVANEAAGILVREGVQRQSVLVTPYEGNERRVVLAYGTRMAVTKPCGDWSENLRANQFNESGPNFGCSVRQNMAAMVADPSDFVHPKPVTPAQSVSQETAVQSYISGEWTTPVDTSGNTFGQ